MTATFATFADAKKIMTALAAGCDGPTKFEAAACNSAIIDEADVVEFNKLVDALPAASRIGKRMQLPNNMVKPVVTQNVQAYQGMHSQERLAYIAGALDTVDGQAMFTLVDTQRPPDTLVYRLISHADVRINKGVVAHRNIVLALPPVEFYASHDIDHPLASAVRQHNRGCIAKLRKQSAASDQVFRALFKEYCLLASESEELKDRIKAAINHLVRAGKKPDASFVSFIDKVPCKLSVDDFELVTLYTRAYPDYGDVLSGCAEIIGQIILMSLMASGQSTATVIRNELKLPDGVPLDRGLADYALWRIITQECLVGDAPDCWPCHECHGTVIARCARITLRKTPTCVRLTTAATELLSECLGKILDTFAPVHSGEIIEKMRTQGTLCGSDVYIERGEFETVADIQFDDEKELVLALAEKAATSTMLHHLRSLPVDWEPAEETLSLYRRLRL
jgi:hypothetical protein